MPEPSVAGAGGGTSGGQGQGPAIDWEAIEGSREFRELADARRGFLVAASVFFLAFFLAYLLLAALAPGFMSTKIWGGMPIGFLLAAAQIFMTWILTWMYIRRSNTVFEPLERRAAESAASVAERSSR